ICFGFFTAHSLTATLVSETAEHHKGTASSLYFIAYYTGVAIGSSILGPVYEHINWIGFVLIVSLFPLIYFIFIIINTNQYINFYVLLYYFFFFFFLVSIGSVNTCFTLLLKFGSIMKFVCNLSTVPLTIVCSIVFKLFNI